MTVTGTLQTTPVFAWNHRSEARIKINQGGTSSGKTYAILQVIFLRLIEKPRIATVIAEDIPNIKKGALRDFQDRILAGSPWMNEYIETYNKTERTYTFKNGSKLEFTSFKDEKSARSGKRDIAFFNEANSIEYTVYKQIAMRTTEEIFIDYNPSEEFWVHDEIMADKNATTFYSNFTHNPYIDQYVREYILHLKTRDPESWEVYGLGKTGAISETIFKNVTIVEAMPANLRSIGYGMDFGYTNDPTTLYHCGLQNQLDVYIDEQFYEYQMRAASMNERMNELQVSKKRIIWCDSSEPRLIDDLQDYGWKTIGATKGDGSVNYGISLLQGYNLHITERSINILNERRKYKFKVDKKTGRVTSDPIDAWNHGWDAVRYWAMMNLKPVKPRTGVSKREYPPR